MMLKEYRHGLQTRASLCGYLKIGPASPSVFYPIDYREYLSINPELEICHIRSVKKDQVFKELKVPYKQVKATLKSIPGNPSTTYKLIIQIDNLLFIEQFELVHFNRRKMIEIINCFNPTSPSVF